MKDLPMIVPPGVPAGVALAFSTRRGGVSAPPFESLNLGRSVGDRPEDVSANRQRVLDALGFGSDALAVPGQVHGADIIRVDGGGLYPGFDGIVTTTPGILLGITAADCAAVLLVDFEAGVVGACHAGWRGCVGGVTENCVAEMVSVGARPEAIRAWIGPSISADCFEVGEEVAAEFDTRFVRRSPGAPRPFVDLPAAVRSRLEAVGLRPEHVHSTDRCTVGEPDVFFSHRGQHGKTGRMMGLIGLR